MKDIIRKNGPVGAWVKKADFIFTNLERRTEKNGTFNRLDWQLFNYLQRAKRTTAKEITEYLSLLDPEHEIHNVINRFMNDGLTIAYPNDVIAISPKGEKVFEEVLKIQGEIQEKALKGISIRAYSTTIDTLQKIIDNLSEYLPEEAISTKSL